MTLTQALTPLATSYGVDLTPLRESEQAFDDKAAALIRDLAAWIAGFHAKEASNG